ncbi:MAG: FlgD immunoglobulin-like domain containing protein, partial [Fidelibacterota bacterium]
AQTSITGTGTGIVTLRDADRPVTRTYMYLNTEQSISFTLPGPTLFRGQVGFSGSQFSGSVRIPNDLSYSPQPGYLSFYCWGDGIPFSEAMGSIGGLTFVGGEPSADHTGPQIQFETETGRILGNGDHLFNDENLIVRLSDPLGINLTGEIGHSIQVALREGDEAQEVNDRFIYDLNSITTGTFTLFNEELSDGDLIQIQAWDNANNPSASQIKLFKNASSGLALMNVMNFPNPFRVSTDFTFELSEPADVTIDIFTLKGRKIHTLGPVATDAGFNTISWYGRDAYGQNLANGVYLYRIKAKNANGSVTRIEKLAKHE